MLSNPVFLICAALFPAVALCIFIFKKDRVEKEPVGLLLKLFGLGAFICFPAAFLEESLQLKANTVLAQYVDMPFFKELYMAVKAFIVVALVEEGLKFVVLYFMTRNNKNFNSLFDGIVYAVFVSLGFAALENIFYVLENGFGNAVSRAIMSVPGHMFFAVIMGYYYSFWHMYDMAGKQERELMNCGLINTGATVFSGKRHLVMSVIMPTLAHGLYDYGLFMGTIGSVLLTMAFIVFLYVYCFRRIGHMSNKDVDDITYSSVLIYEKYPHLRGIVQSGDTENQHINI